MGSIHRRFVFISLAVTALAFRSIEAQQQANLQADTEAPGESEGIQKEKLPTREELEQRIAALSQSTLDEAQRKKAAEHYQAAIQSLAKIEEQIALKAKKQGYIDKRNENVAKQKALLAAPVPETPLPPETAELSVWEEDVAARAAALKEKREDYEWYKAEPGQRAKRLMEIPQQLSELRAELEKVEDGLTAAANSTPKELAEARMAELRARAEELKTTIAAIEKEQELYGLGPEVVHLNRDRMAREVIAWEKRLEQARNRLNERRQNEANRQVAIAANAAKVKRPKALEDLAAQNKKLAEHQKQLVQERISIEKQLKATEEVLANIKDEFKRSESSVDKGELSEASGQLLRQRQEKLPSTSEIRRRNALRQPELTDAAIQAYLVYEERGKLTDIDEQVEAVLAQVPASERAWVERDVRELLQTQRDYLDELHRNYTEYSADLAKLNDVESNLIQTTNAYAEFIAKRVFWTRSCSVLQPEFLKPSVDAFAWSMLPSNWMEVIEAFRQAGRRAPAQLAIFVVAFPILMVVQRRSRQALREIGERAARRDCIEFRLTLKALWLTLVISLPWPALLLFAGWCLDSPLNESEFVRSLSGGLQFTAWCLLLVELWRHLCRAGGLAETHFDWPASAVSHLRRSIRWLGVLGTPLILWSVGLDLQRQQVLWSESLGRVLFIAIMLLLSVVLWRVLMMEGGPFRQFVERKPDNWLNSLHRLWCPLVAAAPVLLAVAAFAGYYYTALQLALRGVYTIALVLAIAVAGGLLQRWMLVSRRKLAREQARQRRAQAVAAAAAAASTDEGAAPPVEPSDEGVDLAVVSEQTQKLIRTVLAVVAGVSAWYLWRDMFPAVAHIFDTSIFRAENSITWADLLIGMIALVFTWICVKNVPGLLELTLLQNLPLDAGSRYAISTITRYVLTTVGIIIAASKVGIMWSNIQWLVAAMGVGLGFGLQEIFANFISGIILLFERPIRVGDIITLGDKSGVVNRIRMRATTIVDFERKEFIIPNKDLVTERLLNWTLSDQINRIELRVGVAYGSDTDRACELLLEAANEQPEVLIDPPPHAVFDGFGDSSLNLVLRCFLPNLERRLPTIHALHTAVDRKFREANIEIPFPQRDLWVRGASQDAVLRVNQEHAPSNRNGSTHSRA